MKKCDCYEEYAVYTSSFTEPESKQIKIGRCNGTKERDECSCEGDPAKCDFYPEKRSEGKKDDEIDKFKIGLIEAIKTAGEMIIENAEDIAGKTKYMTNLNISVNFNPEFKSVPELTITRSHWPEQEKIEHILDLFK